MIRDSTEANVINGKSMITDSSGYVQYEKIYHTPEFIELMSVITISNGDFLFVGGADFNLVSGEDAYVLRTDSTLNAPPLIGVKTKEKIIPTQFNIHQNKPNPFNSSTDVIYEVPALSHVKVSIYDVLGREIAVLVNQKQHAGKYEVVWDATNFPSGVYFYKLIADNYTQTKKMVLTK
jgi:hypothetical protein